MTTPADEGDVSRVIVEALAPLDYELTVLTVSSSAAKLPKSSKLFRTHTSNVFMTNAVNKTDNTHLKYGCFA